MAAAALTTSTEKIPMRKVQMEERRKHHHFLSTRHSSLSIRGMPWPQHASLHYTLWVLLTSGAKVSILSPIFIVKDVYIPHLATSDVVSEIRKMQKWHNIHFCQDCLGLWAAFCIVRLSILLLCCDVQCWQGAISLVPLVLLTKYCHCVLPVIMPWCLNAGCCVPFIMSPPPWYHQH